MMKRVLCLLAVSSLGCPQSNSGSEPDPRLGTLFVEFGEVSADPSQGGVSFINGVFAADSAGTVHLVGTLKPSREFGQSNVHFNKAQYWRITRAGKVEEKAGPAYSASSVTNANLSLRIGLDDDQPVLVQLGGLAAGKLVAFFAFDGTTWKEKTFGLSQRPDGLTAVAFGPTDQLRVLGHDQYLLQLQNRLLRSTETGWTSVPLPPRATSIRLVNGDAASMRVVWLDAEGRLSVGTYARDRWTLNREIGSTQLASPLTDFGSGFSTSGGVDAFVMDVGGATYLFAGNTFTRTGDGADPSRPPLLLLRHPTRALRGLTKAVFLGRDTGSVTALTPGLTQVNCSSVDAGTPMVTGNDPLGRDLVNPFPNTPEARRCLPRKVDVQMVPEPDVSGMILVTIDRAQDAVARGYVKHVPFPVGADPFYGPAPSGLSVFPGDDGITDRDPELQPKIVGDAYLVGDDDQSKLSITIASMQTNQSETTQPRPDGHFESLPLAPGDYTVRIAAPGVAPFKMLRATITGSTRVDVGGHVLNRPGIFPAAYRLGTPLLGFDPFFNSFQVNGATIERGNWALNPSFSVITTAAATTPAPVFEAELSTINSLVGWQEGAVTRYSVSGFMVGYTNVSLPDFRLVGRAVPAVASGPVDGVTPRDWKWNTDVPLVTGAVELAVSATGPDCLAMAAWLPEDGGITARWRPTCNSGATTQAITGDVPTPPLTFLPTDTVITAFQGLTCGKASGFLNPCPLFVIAAGQSTRLSNNAVEVRGSLFLERTGSVGTLKRYDAVNRTSVAVANNLSLPTSYASDAHSFYVLQSGAAVVRTREGFTFQRLMNAPVPLAVNVMKSWAVKNELFLVSSSGADCSAGCSVEQISSLNMTYQRSVLMNGASGSEQVGLAGANYTVWSERSWAGCPGGPCSVISRTDDALVGPQVLTRGSLVPMPDRAPFRPLLFSQFNEDGGAALPSTVR